MTSFKVSVNVSEWLRQICYWGSLFERQVMGNQEVFYGYIPHTETNGRNGFNPEHFKEIIISSTTKERTAIFRVGIKHFENNICIVIKTTSSGIIEFGLNPFFFYSAH